MQRQRFENRIRDRVTERTNSFVSEIQGLLEFIRENHEMTSRNVQIKIKDPENALFLGDSKFGPIALDYSNIYNMKILNVGQTGSGKSYMARKLIEELLEKESIVFVCDPEGEWVTLRGCYNIVLLGKSKQFGRCDIEINKENIEFVIEQCIRLKTPAVLCLNEWSDHSERLELVTLLNTFLLYKIPNDVKYNNITVVFEEAQRFAPRGIKNPDKATQASTLSLKEFMSQCRRRKVSAILITQRPAKLHSDIVSQCNVRLIGRVDQDADIRSLSEFLDLKPKQHYILKELQKEFIPKGEYFCHHGQLPKDTIITFSADKVRSPHLDLRDVDDYDIPAPKSELRDKINFITSQLGTLTQKTEQEKEEIGQNKNLQLTLSSAAPQQDARLRAFGQTMDMWLAEDDKTKRFEYIVSHFGIISIQNLYVLAIEDYNETKAITDIIQWTKASNGEYKCKDDEVYVENEKINSNFEDSDYFLNEWKKRIRNEKYERLLDYLYLKENDDNSIGEISRELKFSEKEIKELHEKYEKKNLILKQENDLYLNPIFFDDKIYKKGTRIDIEDDFDDFEEIDGYND